MKNFPGSTSREITQRERSNALFARQAAAEGMVLLENDGILPLAPDTPVALYGGGALRTVKGGTGSGSVNNRNTVSIVQGLRDAGYFITDEAWLRDFETRMEKAKKEWKDQILSLASVMGENGEMTFDSLYRAHASHPMEMPEGAPVTAADIPEEDRENAAAIVVISRISGEGADRKAVRGDYYLSETEERLLQDVTAAYRHVIVVLNVGGVMDLSFLDRIPVNGLILMSLAGQEGGHALADLISGRVNPSGRLTDTWAVHYEDYPTSATFSGNDGNVYQEKYEEGIYVGYRYFDRFGMKPRYPFGYGLSYTRFEIRVNGCRAANGVVTLDTTVTNTGKREGSEVVQVYAACPDGIRRKEDRRLVAFARTCSIPAGESVQISLTFPLTLLSSYHTGRSAYFLDAGDYSILVGDSSRHVHTAAVLQLRATEWLQKLTPVCPLQDALRELMPDDDNAQRRRQYYLDKAKEDGAAFLPIDGLSFTGYHAFHAQNQEKEAAVILNKLTNTQKVHLVCGEPQTDPAMVGSAGRHVPGAGGETTNLLAAIGIPPVIMADGPAGLRLRQCYEVNPDTEDIEPLTRVQELENRLFGDTFPHRTDELHYQFATALPVGTLLAQTWDTDLMTQAGRRIGTEMDEFGIGIWLAPGMNIHRNPLCGRNFEYYSEDPLLSGLMAAAITRGVQEKPWRSVAIKHFACNNQEENRRSADSVVSERTLREIYLKGFEIAVKTAFPHCIMTSYNKINGVHTANSSDLCTRVLRSEWGFDGVVMTDWTTTNHMGGSSAAKCIAAGNDLVMPGTMSDIDEIRDALLAVGDLQLDAASLERSASRVLSLMLTGRHRDEQ